MIPSLPLWRLNPKQRESGNKGEESNFSSFLPWSAQRTQTRVAPVVTGFASSCFPCSMHFIKRWHRLPSLSRANSEVTTNRKNSSRAGVRPCWSRSITGVTRSAARDGRLAGRPWSFSRNSGEPRRHHGGKAAQGRGNPDVVDRVALCRRQGLCRD